jgi:hypothetical protein
LRIKEQETCITLHELDDDDDEKMGQFWSALNIWYIPRIR